MKLTKERVEQQKRVFLVMIAEKIRICLDQCTQVTNQACKAPKQVLPKYKQKQIAWQEAQRLISQQQVIYSSQEPL